jgi:hypothetical protein
MFIESLGKYISGNWDLTRVLQPSATGKGNVPLLRFGKLPKCLNFDSSFWVSGIGIISFSGGPLTGAINLNNYSGHIGLTPVSGVSVSASLLKGRSLIKKSGPVGNCNCRK